MKIVCDCLDTETYDSTTSGGASSSSESSGQSNSGTDSSSSSDSDSSSGSSSNNNSEGSSTISGPYIKSITSSTTKNNETLLTITTSTGTNYITIPTATITNFSSSKTNIGHKISLAINNSTPKTTTLTYDASSVAVSSSVPALSNCYYVDQALDTLAKNVSSGGSNSKIINFEITSGSLNTDDIFETLPKTKSYEVTLNWEINNTPDNVFIYNGEEKIDVTNVNTTTINVLATTVGTVDVTLACCEYIDSEYVAIESKTLQFKIGDPYYYGFSTTAPSSSSTATFIKTLTKHLQMEPETGPILLDCENNTTKYWSFVSPYKVHILNAGCKLTGLTEHTVSLFLTDTNNGYDNMYIYTFPYKLNKNIVVEIIKAE